MVKQKMDSKSFIFLLLVLATAGVAFFVVWNQIQEYRALAEQPRADIVNMPKR